MKLKELFENKQAVITMEFDNEKSYNLAKKDLIEKYGLDSKKLTNDDSMWVLKYNYSSNKQGKDIEKTMSGKPYNAVTTA